MIEGNTGSTDAVFTVSLNTPSGMPVTVHYETSDDTANAGSDYSASNGTLTLAPGVVSRTITVAVKGDASFENDETFSVELSAPTSATIADATGIGKITDDESQPGLAVGGATVVEGNDGSTTVTVTVTLNNERAWWHACPLSAFALASSAFVMRSTSTCTRPRGVRRSAGKFEAEW